MKKLSWIHLYAGVVIALVVWRAWPILRKIVEGIISFFRIGPFNASGAQWVGFIFLLLGAAVVLFIGGGYLLLLIIALIDSLKNGKK